MSEHEEEAQRMLADAQRQAGLGAMLAQLGPLVKTTLDRLKPLIDQPIIRMPYNLPSANTSTV